MTTLQPHERHSQLPAHVADSRNRTVHDRFLQVNGMLTSAAEGAWQYLLTVNGGGAAAMLGFLGAVEKLRVVSWTYWVLSIFVLGLFLVGVARAYLAHLTSHLTLGWIADTAEYYAESITWAEVHVRDQARVDHLRWLPWALGWASMACFFVGIVVAACFLRANAF